MAKKKRKGTIKERQGLLRAASRGNRTIVQELIASRLDVNFCEVVSPLICAVEKGSTRIVGDLIAAGADVNLRDERGLTALDHASSDNMAELLRNHGGIHGELDESKLEEWEKPIEKRRGVIAFESDYGALLILGNVADVARSYAELRKAKVWIEDIDNKDIELTKICFCVFRYRGHCWTELVGRPIDFTAPERAIESNRESRDLRTLSARLNTQAIEFRYSDTAGWLSYTVFDAGEVVEKLVDFEGDLQFTSKLGNQEPDIKDTYQYTETFIRERDAWISGTGFGSFAGYGAEEQPTITIRRPEEVERIDFVSLY